MDRNYIQPGRKEITKLVIDPGLLVQLGSLGPAVNCGGAGITATPFQQDSSGNNPIGNILGGLFGNEQ